MELLKYFFMCILNFIEYPANVLWDYYYELKAKDEKLKILGLTVFAGAGVLLILYVFFKLGYYLGMYHLEKIIILGFLLWFFSYVKSKRDKQNKEMPISNHPALLNSNTDLDSQAEDDYAEMLEVLYQTACEVAPEIGALQPVMPNDMEYDKRWIINNGVIYYNFILVKEDPDLPISLAERTQAKTLLQKVCSKVIAESPVTTHTQKFTDKYGKKHEPITIHAVAQSADYICIQTVYPNDAYAESVHLRNLKNQTRNHSNTIPDASWKS